MDLLNKFIGIMGLHIYSLFSPSSKLVTLVQWVRLLAIIRAWIRTSFNLLFVRFNPFGIYNHKNGGKGRKELVLFCWIDTDFQWKVIPNLVPIRILSQPLKITYAIPFHNKKGQTDYIAPGKFINLILLIIEEDNFIPMSTILGGYNHNFKSWIEMIDRNLAKQYLNEQCLMQLG